MRVPALHVVTHPGERPPLVALHGFTLGGSMFAELAELMGRSILAPDLPGHGGSTGVAADPITATAGVMALLEEAALPLALLGYSMGGRVALRVALDAPHLVDRLILVSTSPGIADPARRADRLVRDQALAARLVEQGTEAFLTEWLGLPMFAGLSRRGPAWQAADRSARSANDPTGLATALVGLGQGATPPLWDRLADLAMPVLIVAGVGDPDYSSIAARMADRIGTATQHIVAGAGHAVIGEAPAEVAAALEAFLTGPFPPPPAGSPGRALGHTVASNGQRSEMDIQRAVIVVMDSLGVGAAPDAAEYGDADADTLGHVADAVGGLDLPNLQAAGLGNLHPAVRGVPPADQPTMAFGRLREYSAAKDSTTGHWEIAGVVTAEPHARFTETGFPPELVAEIEERSGHRFMGNYAASGTVIIEELGPAHLDSGDLILYTSADSVLQIAAHKAVVPLEKLYRVCEIAREAADDYRIGRIIARPFEGELGSFRRTYERRDYAMAPPAPTILDRAMEAGLPTFGVGKIEDLFVGRGLVDAVHTEGDADGLEHTIAAIGAVERGLVFTNLVDLDMLYGHRENPEGYAQGLAVIDSYLPRLVGALGPADLLFLTADHGNDPTDGDTNHTREYTPLLVHGPGAAGVDLGIREQFCDVAATIAEAFGLVPFPRGESFLGRVT